MDNPSWIAVGLAAVAACGAIATGFYGWMNQRDKLRFDAEMTLLKEQHKRCDEDRAKSNEDTAKIYALLEECKRRDEQRDEREKVLMSYIRTNAQNIQGVSREVKQVKETADIVKQEAVAAKQLAETLAAGTPLSGDSLPKPPLPEAPK